MSEITHSIIRAEVRNVVPLSGDRSGPINSDISRVKTSLPSCLHDETWHDATCYQYHTIRPNFKPVSDDVSDENCKQYSLDTYLSKIEKFERKLTKTLPKYNSDVLAVKT